MVFINKYSATLLFFIAYLDCLPACHANQKQDPVNSLERKLDSLIPKLLKNNNTPGVSIAVIRGGKLHLTKAYGLADKQKQIPVSVNTRFQIGSVSKSLTAYG